MDKPRPGDAVLGNNQAPNTPNNAVVLGGIAGAKQRLNSTSYAVKLEALCSALKYDEEGLHLIQQFIQKETDVTVKWVASNWVWLHASDAARAQLINYITCLKHISKELMSSVMATMVTDITDSSVAPVQIILEEIEELHIKEASHKSLTVGYKALVSIGTELISKKASPKNVALAVAYQKLGDLYYWRAQQDKLSKQLPKVVLIAYTEAITYDKDSPTLADILNKRGLAYYYLKDYQAAIKDSSQAIKINPNFAWAYNTRSIAYYEFKDYQAAIKDSSQAIKISPNYASAYYNRGLARSALEDRQAAIEDYTQAIKINPDYTNAYDYRGYDYYILGNYQAAIEDYNQSIKLSPNKEWTYDSRGYAYYKLGNYQAAIKDYEQAIKINPNYQWTYNNRGLLYHYGLKNYQAAIEDYSQAIKINPNFAWPYHNRGDVYSILEDEQAALKDYHQAANLYKEQDDTSRYQEILDRISKLEK
jgi:tetratricopeptide (TPR) repeat protein